MPNINANIMGISTVLTRNALLRIRSRYSRRATSNASCIGFLPNRLDENFFQGRLNQLKAVNLRLLCRGAQQVLRVGVLLKSDFHPPRILLILGNRLMAQKALFAVEIEDDPISFVAGFDRAYAS